MIFALCASDIAALPQLRIKNDIALRAVISLRDDIVHCTMISKRCLDCGIFENLCAILATIYIVSLPGDCHACARNDTGGTPTPERTLIQGVLMHGMGNFKDGTRAATAARKWSTELDG